MAGCEGVADQPAKAGGGQGDSRHALAAVLMPVPRPHRLAQPLKAPRRVAAALESGAYVSALDYNYHKPPCNRMSPS
jgi:hypothetical protein